MNSLINSFWIADVNSINIQYNENDFEMQQMEGYIRKFQQGNFENKQEFIQIFVNSTNLQIFVLGMRVFMAIANHSDFQFLEDYFEYFEEDKIEVFLAFVQESMSLHVIPYLLALYEVWEDTYVAKDIERCICGMLGKKYNDEESYNVEQLGDFFEEFIGCHDINNFYYAGEEYFSGNLTKRIISIAMNCRNKNIEFYTNQLSSILSNGNGIKCPVYYGVKVNDTKIKELYSYVETISSLGQEKGRKYFYNHMIG